MYQEGRQFPQETLIPSPEDYYAILVVPPNARPDEIKRAYRRLARKCHPDLFPEDKAAEEQFKKINEAHQILSDPQKRREYDQSRSQGPLPREQELDDKEFVRKQTVENGFIIGFYRDGMKCLINPINKKRTRAFNPNVAIMFRQGVLIVREGKKEFYINPRMMVESKGFDQIVVESGMVVGYNYTFLGKKAKSREILGTI